MALSEKAQATRTRIVEAANELFYMHGYNATGLDKVINAANVTKGNFYYHFKSKEELASATLDLHFAAAVKEIEEQVLKSKVSPFKKLMALLNLLAKTQKMQHKNNQIKGCYFGNFTLELGAESTAVRATLKRIFEQYLQLIESLLQKSIEAGEISADINPAETSSIILSQMEGATLLDKANQQPGALENSIKFIEQYLRSSVNS